ncbi:MAG: CbbX protein, partial [Prochlorococcus sp.]
SRDELMTIEPADILASRVFQGEVEGRDPAQPLTDSMQ